MSDLKNDLKNVPYIKQFFGEYLDLRKDNSNFSIQCLYTKADSRYTKKRVIG